MSKVPRGDLRKKLESGLVKTIKIDWLMDADEITDSIITRILLGALFFRFDIRRGGETVSCWTVSKTQWKLSCREKHAPQLAHTYNILISFLHRKIQTSSSLDKITSTGVLLTVQQETVKFL